MARSRRVGALVATLITLSLVLVAPARAAVDPVVVTDAVAYLSSTQNPGTDPAAGDGAWDTDLSAFQTFDAVLAIAEAAQTGGAWSTTEAHDAVEGFLNVDGVSPLAYMEVIGNAAATPGRAGKIIVLWAEPLGIDPEAFDPLEDGSPVDLVALVGSPLPNGAYATDLFYSETLYAALATDLTGGTIAASTVQYIRDGQQANGSWSYDHDPSGITEGDVDTTGLSIMTLIAAGVAPTDLDVVAGLAFIARQQEADGTWSFFGSPSSETTSRALLAIAAAGYDVQTSCWRDTVLPSSVGQPFVGGDEALSSFAQPNGSIADPSSFGPVYSTAQSLEGLLRNWLPTVTAAAQTCAIPLVPIVPIADPPGPGLLLLPRFTG